MGREDWNRRGRKKKGDGMRERREVKEGNRTEEREEEEEEEEER